MQYLGDSWYVAAYSREIEDQLFTRTILETPILLYRTDSNKITAISNICPHRFAPLSRGLRYGDAIECPYHGLRFGPDGKCMLNPHTERLDPKMDVRDYRVVERHGLVWVWMGDSPADESLIPDMSEFEDGPDKSICRNYIYADYRYDILIDNLLDLSHADYLHRGSFTSSIAEETSIDVVELENHHVVVDRLQKRSDPGPIMPDVTGKVDILTRIHWTPSQAILFKTGYAPAGEQIESFNFAKFYHIATPESGTKTHYFLGMVREGPADEEADRALTAMQRNVIEQEDGPMLEFVSNHMNGRELMEMAPLVLPVDAGALRARRVMKRLIDQECGRNRNTPAIMGE